MPEVDRPLLGDLKGNLAQAAAEIREMAALRLHLAQIEGREAIAAARRLAVVGAAATVLLLSVLPVLVVCLAHGLARWPGGLSPVAWMAVLALTLAAGGGLAAWLAWRRFRRDFTGFEETLEELREDLVWLKDWAGKAGAADGLKTDGP